MKQFVILWVNLLLMCYMIDKNNNFTMKLEELIDIVVNMKEMLIKR